MSPIHFETILDLLSPGYTVHFIFALYKKRLAWINPIYWAPPLDFKLVLSDFISSSKEGGQILALAWLNLSIERLLCASGFFMVVLTLKLEGRLYS